MVLGDATRKSYILQYAPDGVVKMDGGESLQQRDPDRQYFVVQNGLPVDA